MSPTPRKVLVTGAAGFVGQNVCRALIAAGYTVVGLVHSLPDEAHRLEGIVYATGDVRDLESLHSEDFAPCDAVVHLVGIITPNPGKGQTFESIHVQGTANVVRQASRAGIRHFTYLSALGASATSPSEYARTKMMAERIVAKSEIPYTIFRPSIILGPGCAFAAQIEQLIRRPPLSPFPLPFIPVPGNGKNQFQPVWIDDLTACLVADLSCEAQTGATYEIGGAETVTFNALLTAFAERLGIEKRLFHAPMPLMFSAAALLEAVIPNPPITVDQLLQLRTDNICDNAPVRAAFDIEPIGFTEILSRLYP